MRRRDFAVLLGGALRAGAIMVALCAPSLAQQGPGAQNQGFVPPPRSITDITAILDSEKPDPAKLARYVVAPVAESRPQPELRRLPASRSSGSPRWRQMRDL
jgi:hypothetical protein